MKLKIKLRENKLNEAIETPGIDATAEREAEKVSNEFDAEDMDKEIEGQVDRDENREKLKAIAKKNPFTLPAIAKLLQAHNIAVNNQYKFDYLFEVIKLILSDETSVNSIKTKLGLDLKFILAVDINAADSLESWNEDEIQRNLLSQAVPSTTNEVLDNNDAAMVKKLRDAAGEMSDEEWYKTAVKYIKPKTKKEVVVINDINGLVNKLPGLANSFDEELEEAIEAKAKEGDDPLEILLGPTKDGKLLNNIKSIYIITRILEQFAILAKKHFRATADAASAVDKAADPKYSVDQWTDASENYSEAYRAFTPRLKHVINAASEKFNERIVNLAISGQGLAIARQSGHKQGAGKAVLDKRVKADQAGDYVGVTESLISETEKAEDLNTFYALALYKNKSIEDIEALTSKIKRKDPESIQKQLFRIIEYFERVFEQKLRDVLVKLNKLKGKPAFAERPDIINKIDALTNKFENDGDKDNFKKEFITVNKLMSTDPKSWNEQFKSLLKNIEKYPNQLMKAPTSMKETRHHRRNFEEKDMSAKEIKEIYEILLEGRLDKMPADKQERLRSAIGQWAKDNYPDDPEKTNRIWDKIDDENTAIELVRRIIDTIKKHKSTTKPKLNNKEAIKVGKDFIEKLKANPGKPLKVPDDIIMSPVSREEGNIKYDLPLGGGEKMATLMPSNLSTSSNTELGLQDWLKIWTSLSTNISEGYTDGKLWAYIENQRPGGGNENYFKLLVEIDKIKKEIIAQFPVEGPNYSQREALNVPWWGWRKISNLLLSMFPNPEKLDENFNEYAKKYISVLLNDTLPNISNKYYTKIGLPTPTSAAPRRIAENINKYINKLLKENCQLVNSTNKDLSQLENIISQFYPYVKEKLKFNKDAKLNLISDPENAKDAWGKTAYYNPEAMEITVFVDNRHPKDMLRSISHELVHHSQNCRGEFDQTQALEPGYAQNDPHMRRMEGEAYLLGNGFLVRDFEDYLKSQQNQNLTENKKMKGLTEEQLKTVLENTIKRVLEESKVDEAWGKHGYERGTASGMVSREKQQTGASADPSARTVGDWQPGMGGSECQDREGYDKKMCFSKKFCNYPKEHFNPEATKENTSGHFRDVGFETGGCVANTGYFGSGMLHEEEEVNEEEVIKEEAIEEMKGDVYSTHGYWLPQSKGKALADPEEEDSEEGSEEDSEEGSEEEEESTGFSSYAINRGLQTDIPSAPGQSSTSSRHRGWHSDRNVSSTGKGYGGGGGFVESKTFTSDKDQLLFERLVKKWAKQED